MPPTCSLAPRASCLAPVLLAATTLFGASPPVPPLSPAASLERLHLRDGYEIELVAAEPDVLDPVAIDWGRDGTLWVVEMADYPSGMDDQGSPGGRIRRLRDTTGDGRYDESLVFFDGIPFPTGILAWGKGVLITAAPEILYLEDQDGDGRAEYSQVLYSGFLEGNQQLRVNGLRWGIDNWVYCASGSHHAGYGKDSQILSHLTGATISLGSLDFRFRPHLGQLDPQSGPSQFGRNRDDWGNWFGVQNSHPLWHYVLADHNLRRNPHVEAPDPRQQLLAPRNPKVYPAKSPQKRFHSFAESGRFTSACSATVYRSNLLFDHGEVQHAFTCEPFHNLVQHNLIVDDGVSFRSYRDPAESERDFFASADRWCRPVMVRTGPDGAIWIVDMYRYMIEHPRWLPKEGQDELRPYFRSGDDRGRIYRVFPTGRRPKLIESFEDASIEELVSMFESPSGTLRDMVQRQLVFGGGGLGSSKSTQRSASESDRAVKALVALFETSSNARARLHALSSLDGLQALSSSLIATALKDPHGGVRRQAVRLACESRGDIVQLLALAEDPDPKVRLELASGLGDFEDPRAAEGMIQLAAQDADNHFLQAALLSSVDQKNINRLVRAAVENDEFLSSSRSFIRQLFGYVGATASPPLVATSVEFLCAEHNDERWQYNALGELLDALKRRGREANDCLDDVQSDQLQALIQRAHEVADSDAPVELRSAALRLFLRLPDQTVSDYETIADMLGPQTPFAVQQSAIARLGLESDRRVADVLLARWHSHSPSIRGEIITVLKSRRTWIAALLQRLADDRMTSADIDLISRQQLLAASAGDQRDELEKALHGASSLDRKEVLAKHKGVLQMSGDARRGREIFGKKCATCHRQENVGYEVGPNLASLTNRSSEALLTSLLDPNAAVEAKYVQYLVVRADGRSETGMLATETGSSLTLLAAEGKRIAILRSEIDEVLTRGKSLMPEGLERDLSPQDLSDVIAYVQGL